MTPNNSLRNIKWQHLISHFEKLFRARLSKRASPQQLQTKGDISMTITLTSRHAKFSELGPFRSIVTYYGRFNNYIQSKMFSSTGFLAPVFFYESTLYGPGDIPNFCSNSVPYQSRRSIRKRTRISGFSYSVDAESTVSVVSEKKTPKK
jgi:hypothetical protein